MVNKFYKFPSTPHLSNISKIDIRNDKIFSVKRRQIFLLHEIFIEEKIDGACLGISFDSNGNLLAQNRGNYLSAGEGGQWKALWGWINRRTASLFDALSDNYILFGEWCYAQHSVFYDNLPDWFIGFDVYDKREQNFLAHRKRNKILESANITTIPLLGNGYYEFDDLKNFFGTSKFGNSDAEGIYLRYDDNNWLGGRAKLISPNFIQDIDDHWSQSHIKMNRLAYIDKTTKNSSILAQQYEKP